MKWRPNADLANQAIFLINSKSLAEQLNVAIIATLVF